LDHEFLLLRVKELGCLGFVWERKEAAAANRKRDAPLDDEEPSPGLKSAAHTHHLDAISEHTTESSRRHVGEVDECDAFSGLFAGVDG
jgi:hypothetical protein